jgi:hypothetical protein
LTCEEDEYRENEDSVKDSVRLFVFCVSALKEAQSKIIKASHGDHALIIGIELRRLSRASAIRSGDEP